MSATILLGAGGHARVLVDCLLASDAVQVEGILDPDESTWGREIWGVRVLGGEELMAALKARGVEGFIVAVGSAKDTRPRQRAYDNALRIGLKPVAVRHPAAICSGRIYLGQGVQLLAGAIVNAGARLGDNVLVNTGAIIEHDCDVADHCHVASGARLAGEVRLGIGVHVGVGATVRQGIVVGPHAVIGAGAVVVKDVVAETVVVGVPARPLPVLCRPGNSSKSG